jgi:hypothetical protein
MWSRLALTVLFVGACAAPVRANAGVFFGSGQTVRLGTSADIQLVSEDVTIRPLRSGWLMDGSIGRACDRVEYECRFQLKNLTDKPVSVQVGFPLNSQFTDTHYRPENSELDRVRAWSQDSGELVRQYKFIARERDRTYHPRFVFSDQDKKLKSIFLWDMKFEPNETRQLDVSYEMSMSMAATSMSKNEGAETFAAGLRPEFHFDPSRDASIHSKEWYRKFEEAMVEWFEYVTETGRTWAGKVDRAKFQIDLRPFEEYLQRRGWQEFLHDGPRTVEEAAKWAAQLVGRKVLVHRTITPGGWTTAKGPTNVEIWIGTKGVISWEYKDYRPEKLIRVCYWITSLPDSVGDLRRVIGLTFGKDPAREDLEDMREILLAVWGIAPTRARVKRFVSEQIWYAPQDGRAIANIEGKHREMLDVLDEMIKTAKDQAVPAGAVDGRRP